MAALMYTHSPSLAFLLAFVSSSPSCLLRYFSPCPSYFCWLTAITHWSLQFMFALLAPNTIQPQLLPVVHLSGSLPFVKGIYIWNYTRRLSWIRFLLSFISSRGYLEGGRNYKPIQPLKNGWQAMVKHKHTHHCMFCACAMHHINEGILTG